MRVVILLMSICLLSCIETTSNSEVSEKTNTIFILIRHAEKQDDGSKDPDLSEAGVNRAQELTKILSETQVDAIYSTTFKRTMNTVAPLAQAKGLEVQAYEPMNGENMDKILAENRGRTIVVSGHSNTTPWVANYLLGSETYSNFEDSDYDNLMIVSVIEMGNAKVTRLTYGAMTK